MTGITKTGTASKIKVTYTMKSELLIMLITWEKGSIIWMINSKKKKDYRTWQLDFEKMFLVELTTETSKRFKNTHNPLLHCLNCYCVSIF